MSKQSIQVPASLDVATIALGARLATADGPSGEDTLAELAAGLPENSVGSKLVDSELTTVPLLVGGQPVTVVTGYIALEAYFIRNTTENPIRVIIGEVSGVDLFDAILPPGAERSLVWPGLKMDGLRWGADAGGVVGAWKGYQA